MGLRGPSRCAGYAAKIVCSGRRPIVGLLLLLGAVLVAAGCGPAIGTVDSQRVLNESVKALQYQKQLDDREKQMAAELQALAPQVSRADLTARRARLLTELTQMRRDLEAQLNQEINQVAGRIAQREGLKVVVVKGATVAGGRDITQQVIDQLK